MALRRQKERQADLLIGKTWWRGLWFVGGASLDEILVAPTTLRDWAVVQELCAATAANDAWRPQRA
jgi:hypothetical protein